MRNSHRKKAMTGGGRRFQTLMDDLRRETSVHNDSNPKMDDPITAMDDPDWDLWEEWMGWEGAGIRDYSSHINPYI
ncbi:hypothetical protein L1987_79977 [Smallanthus sonchifolius]|uniref:Uncharacterized protein n=1 Tax=Smallanthus sonchifolius TaxID=185202 RepID=A0ACB8YLZ3_9ASTR|nr:hypothetical protein L1987_79977 [Smallanthus sonchifolius]